jgi:branched-chain amino acid transport system permease protein
MLQSWMSLLSNAWLVYVGVLFIVMVIYAPGGIAGLVLAHRPIWRAGRLGALALPYLRIVPPGLATLIGFVGLVELCTFVTIGAGQGKALVLFGHELYAGSSGPWLVAAALFVGGGSLMLREARVFAAAWHAVGEEIKARETVR